MYPALGQVCAKTMVAAVELSKAFADRRVQKKYHALVVGEMSPWPCCILETGPGPCTNKTCLHEALIYDPRFRFAAWTKGASREEGH